MRRGILFLFFLLFLCISILPSRVYAGSAKILSSNEVLSFSDVSPDAWYHDAVKNAVQSKYMIGVSGNKFAPDELITKKMLAIIMYNIEYLDKNKHFDGDREPILWGNNAFDWAVSNNIVVADESGIINQEGNITRQEMAMILRNYAKHQGRNIDHEAELSLYSDVNSIADRAQDSVSWAVSAGLIKGTGSSSLSPDSFATRAQVAQVLMRYIHGMSMEERTSKYISQFIKGNFNDFYTASSEELQKNISIEELIVGWNTIIQSCGVTDRIISNTFTGVETQDKVISLISCTLYDIKVTIIYGNDAEPVGIWTGYEPKEPPIPQHTDRWEENAITVGDKSLPGMLTLPKNIQKPPVIILVQGSGPSDMNESIGTTPNRPFEDIAHGLADKGIATLRYNKRTYQYPADGGDTIEYEVLNDVAEAIEMLVDDQRVDANGIYVLGHSLGGMMTPKIALDNPKIKGIISMAGSLRSLQDIILDQNKASLTAESSLTGQQKDEMYAQVEAEIKKTKTLDDGGTGHIMGVPTSYWESLNAINSLSIIKKLNIPMLILQGDADFQVSKEKDYKLWQEVLAGRTNVTFRLYDGLSHLFMPNQIPAKGTLDVSIYNAPNHLELGVIEDIASWVDKQ